MDDDNVIVKVSLVLLLLFSLYILWPFVSALLFAIILAYFSYPLYGWMKKRTTKNIAALNLSAAVAAAIIIMVAEGARVFLRELGKLYRNLPELLQGFEALQEIEFMGMRIFEEATNYGLSTVMNYITGLGARIPRMFFSLLVFFVGYFYFLTQGEKVYRYIKKNLPLGEERKGKILGKIKMNVDAFIRAEIIIAVAQGAVGGIIFYTLGHPYPFFFAIVIGILAFIPVVGPSLVYWPVGLFEIIRQNYILGISYIITGICIISTMDYFLRPRIMGNKAKIHPFVVLLGFLGGIYAFGPAGILIGPVILSLAIILIDELKREELA